MEAETVIGESDRWAFTVWVSGGKGEHLEYEVIKYMLSQQNCSKLKYSINSWQDWPAKLWCGSTFLWLHMEKQSSLYEEGTKGARNIPTIE